MTSTLLRDIAFLKSALAVPSPVHEDSSFFTPCEAARLGFRAFECSDKNEKWITFERGGEGRGIYGFIVRKQKFYIKKMKEPKKKKTEYEKREWKEKKEGEKK